MATNKSTKRTQLDKDKTMMFIVISVAAVVTIGSLVIAKGFIGQGSYVRKVAGKKEVAVKQLETNKAAVDTLSSSYKTFISQNPNLLGGNPASQDDRGGTNADLVLNALPNRYDFPALASSIEKLLTGYKVNGISGTDDTIAQEGGGVAGPVEIPFSVDIVASYDGFRNLIGSFNRSIRPIQILRLELNGTSGNLQTSIQAKTYYQPEVGVQIKKVQVP